VWFDEWGTDAFDHRGCGQILGGCGKNWLCVHVYEVQLIVLKLNTSSFSQDLDFSIAVV